MRLSFTFAIVVVALAGCAPEEDTRPEAQRANLTSEDGGATTAGDAGAPQSAPADAGAPSDAAPLTAGGDGAAVEGEACDEDAAAVPCDVDSNGPVTAATCWIGQRACAEGLRGRCVAYGPRFR